MDRVKWGIIGCGDVAEVKSGPAFNLAKNSELLAVMRRDASKAEDFAKRHHVPLWYSSADELLKNTDLTAVYIATPPASHLEYTLKALKAGKDVYLEKPMALNAIEASSICSVLNQRKNKLSVAHYRRKLPAFLKVKELIDSHHIGQVLTADIKILQPASNEMIAKTSTNWRLNPEISGGGYFHDIAPHQLDLMYYYFGEIKNFVKIESTKKPLENAVSEDVVQGAILFKNGVQFSGIWNFNSSSKDKKDECIITGSEGKIIFSFYGESVLVIKNGKQEIFNFENPTHIQQPMIAATVNYFLNSEVNPCPAKEGLLVMEVIDTFTS